MKKFNGKLRDVRKKDLTLLENNPTKFWKDVSVIDNGAFKYLVNLEHIDIPSTIKKIDSNAFYCCDNLKSVVLHDGLEELGGCVFLGCKSLENLEFPNTVKIIESNTFDDCLNLKSVKLPDGIETIGWNMFDGCENLEEITLPNSVKTIGATAFKNCRKLKKIVIPENVEQIENQAFAECPNLEKVVIKSEMLNFDYIPFRQVFTECEFNKTYISRDGKEIIISKEKLQNIEDSYIDLGYSVDESNFILNANYRKNKVQVENWKTEGTIKFIPPDYTLKVFPNSQIKNYFVNNNHLRYGKLVKTLCFDKLSGNEKLNSLSDLMKIYYAIGGFSSNQGESERAYNYVLNFVAKTDNPNASPEEIGFKVHSKFSGLNLYGEYNKTFAQFFMKYYKDNPNFMNFNFINRFGYAEEKDFLCSAHNNFNLLLKNYPNMVVNGNEERSLLTPRFVAEHSNFVQYENVGYNNQELANLVGQYGYSQDQFNYIQTIFERAKKLIGRETLKIYPSELNDVISFRLLKKDDPLGFVLGNITNCCQCIDDAGGSCVVDGYINVDAGFLVFEVDALDDNGKVIGAKRIIGQAYVWYDPKTQTVCMDNIEIPTKVLKELRSGENKNSKITMSAFVDAVEKSAISLMGAMNDDKTVVNRITTGEGYNDLKTDLAKHFPIEHHPIAKHRGYHGYSDASKGQYILKTYNEFTDELAQSILLKLKLVKQNLDKIQNSVNDENSKEVKYE